MAVQEVSEGDVDVERERERKREKERERERDARTSTENRLRSTAHMEGPPLASLLFLFLFLPPLMVPFGCVCVKEYCGWRLDVKGHT